MIFDIEKYSKIPDGWSKVKLSDLADFNAKSWSKKDKPETINYIDISSVSTGKVAEPTEMKFDSAPSRARRKVDKGDIIISTVRPNLKQFALLDFNNDNLTASTGFCTITPKKPEYTWLIYSVVTTDIFTEHLVRVAQGAAYPAIKPSDISEAYIGLPPQEELHKLNALIGALWQKQTINEAMNQTLEKLAQRIFKSWFIDFDPVKANKEGLPFDGLSPEIQALFPSEFEDSELGMIPKGWEVKPFSSIAKLQTKSAKPALEPEKEWVHYSIPAYDETQFPTLDLGETIKSNKYKMLENTILVSKLNPRFKRIWFPYIESNDTSSVCSTEFMQFIPMHEDWYAYTLSYVISNRFQSEMLKTVSGTTGSRQRAQPKEVSVIPALIPSSEILESFSGVALPLIRRHQDNLVQIHTLKNLRDRLLPKLVSGQISVGEAEQELAEAV